MPENQRSCPICLDTFSDPRLLQCAHTFCRHCLQQCKSDFDGGNDITCPICRDTTCFGRNGLDGLLTNYFVPDKRTVRSLVCGQCGGGDHVRSCLVCEERICLRCRSMHKCVWVVQSSSASGPEVEQTFRIPFRPSIGRIKTTYGATLLSEFCTEYNSEKGSKWINAIVPINETEAWVVSGNGPYVIRYDMLGKEKERVYIGRDVIDAALSPDGCLFLLCLEHNGVIYLKNGKRYLFIRLRSHIKPMELSVFPDGRVVVIANEIDDEPESEAKQSHSEGDDLELDGGDEKDDDYETSICDKNPQSKKKDREGLVFILDKRGQITNSYSRSGRKFRPFSVSCSPVMDSICIGDTKSNSVDIILSDGTVMGEYPAGPFPRLDPRLDFMRFLPSLYMHHEPFHPLGITVDSDGMYYVADGESKLIHVITPTGDLVGIVATSAPEGFGLPTQIELDASGKLWTGDGSTGTVKVYRISQYVNEFKRSLFE